MAFLDFPESTHVLLQIIFVNQYVRMSGRALGFNCASVSVLDCMTVYREDGPWLLLSTYVVPHLKFVKRVDLGLRGAIRVDRVRVEQVLVQVHVHSPRFLLRLYRFWSQSLHKVTDTRALSLQLLLIFQLE